MSPVRGGSEGRLGILADDLSGAMEVAGEIARVGWTPWVSSREGPPVGRRPRQDALVYCTDSRTSDHAEAVERARAGLRALRRFGADHLAVKVDSLWRGWPLAPFEALKREGLLDGVVLCPAHPTLGRTVRAGSVAVPEDGSSGIPPSKELLDRATLVPAGRLLSRQPNGALPSSIFAGASVVICDADAVSDVDRMIELAARDPRRLLIAGSAEVCARFAHVLRHSERWSGRRSVVVAIGSRHPKSREQLAYLERFVGAWREVGGGQGSATLQGTLSVGDAEIDIYRVQLRSEHQAAGSGWLGVLTDAIAGVTEEVEPDLLVVSGGDTGMRVCQRLGISTWRPIEVLEPGVVVCVGGVDPAVGPVRPPLVVVKPGSYGEVDVLVRCVKAAAFREALEESVSSTGRRPETGVE